MSAAPVQLDGQAGEGGGQIIRTALALSLITGKPFTVSDIRGKRSPPGLQPQHVTCVKAAQTIGQAEVSGANLGSRSVAFSPTSVRAGDYLFDVGTAGSTALLFQTLCFPLALAGAASNLKLRGGTHVSHSPSIHHLSLVWGPMLKRLGYHFELELERAGFYPEGGGEVTARIIPAEASRNFSCTARGTLLEAQVLSVISGVPMARAGALSSRALQLLRERGVLADADNLPLPSPRSRGAAVMVHARFEHAHAGFSELAEEPEPLAAADRAASAFARFMEQGCAIDAHLGDQLLLPLAIAAAGLQGGRPTTGRFTTVLTSHLLTQAEVIRQFLDVRVAVRGDPGEEGEIVVAPAVKIDV
jgi:RNA 3'-terminal phosphate cyclase (ATP)